MLKINIVEDIPEIRNTIQYYINENVSDMDCPKVYANAEDALGGLLLHQPDVVLMDIGLPKMTGVECMVKVKDRYPNMKFLMFTVFDNDEQVFDALKSGADGYILKRESALKIVEYLRDVYAGGAPMSKNIAAKVIKSFRTKPESPSTPLGTLTQRQDDILQKLSQGLPYKLIADELGITIGTVKQHIHQIYKKLQVRNKTEAINKYFNRQSGL